MRTWLDRQFAHRSLGIASLAVLVSAMLAPGCEGVQYDSEPVIERSQSALVAYVQKKSGLANSSSVSASFSSTPVEGNLMVAVVGNWDARTVTGPSGWTTALNEGNNSPGLSVFYKIAGAGEATGVSASFSSSTYVGIQLLEFSDVDPNSPLEDVVSASGTSSSIGFGSVDVAGDNAVLVAAAVDRYEQSFSSWSNSFSEQFDYDHNRLLSSSATNYGVAYRLVTSPGTYTTSASTTFSKAYRTQLLAFRRTIPIPSTLTQSASRLFFDEDGVTGFGDGSGVATSASASTRLRAVVASGGKIASIGESSSGFWYEERASTQGALESGFGSSGTLDVLSGGDGFGIATDDTHIYGVGVQGSSYSDWAIEKRALSDGSLDTAFGSSGQIVNSVLLASLTARGIAIDGSHMYVVGENGGDWRVEKRATSNGALVGGFGSSGAIDVSVLLASLSAYDVATDGTYLYVVGFEESSWRIEKRSLSTGSLVSGFGTSGVIKVSAGTIARAVTVAGSSIIVVGTNDSGDMRIEKRAISDGSLDTGFDGDGVIVVGSTSGAYDVVSDGASIFVAGIGSNGWRVEKRALADGSLDTSFDGDGIIDTSEGTAAYGLALSGTSLFIVGEDGADGRTERRLATTGALVADSVSVTTPLAAQDTAVDLPLQGVAFRLRTLLDVETIALSTANSTAFKLQYAEQSGACDTAFSGESFADVGATTPISYALNSTAADGQNMAASAGDPVRSGRPTQLQTFEEDASFTHSRTSIAVGESGLWDFSLQDYGAAAGTTYCLRLVHSDGSLLDNYLNVPELTTAAPPTPITDLVITAGVAQNTIAFEQPPEFVSEIIILAQTTGCTFSGEPDGFESVGDTVGGATVIYHGDPGADSGPTAVTVAGSGTTVSWASATQTLTHALLTAGTSYCYRIVARNAWATDDASGGGRPALSATPISGDAEDPDFVFSTGSTALSAPAVIPGSGVFYANNSGTLLGVADSGTQSFSPYSLTDGVQNRSPVGTLSGDSDATIFLASLSGDVSAVWATGASAGTLRWSSSAIDGDNVTPGDQALGDALYGSPLVSNSMSRVFVATRNSGAAENRVFGLDLSDGTCVWVFNGTCAGSTSTELLGQISQRPIHDTTNKRLFLTSSKISTGHTIWAIDSNDTPAGDRRLWSRDLGHIDASATFASAARTSLFVPTNDGRIYKLDSSDGTTCWGSTSDGCGTATGSEEFFCAQTGVDARATSCSGNSIQVGLFLIYGGTYAGHTVFSTADGYVRRVDADGVQQWKTAIAGAGFPLVMTNVADGVVYIGGNEGQLHQLDLATGISEATRNVGGGSVVVGDPSFDYQAAKVYVTTSEGKLYAFDAPF